MSVTPISFDKIYFLYGKEPQTFLNKTHICYGYTDNEQKTGDSPYDFYELGSDGYNLVKQILNPTASTMEESSLDGLKPFRLGPKIIISKNEAYRDHQEGLMEKISRFAQAIIVCSKHAFVALKDIRRSKLIQSVAAIVIFAGLSIVFNSIADHSKPIVRPGATQIELAQASQNLKELLKPFKRLAVGYGSLGVAFSLILSGFCDDFQHRYVQYYNEFGPPKRFYKLVKLEVAQT